MVYIDIVDLINNQRGTCLIVKIFIVAKLHN